MAQGSARASSALAITVVTSVGDPGSDTNVPSEKAVRTAIASAATGTMTFKGELDCSANPDYPAADRGDFYLVSVAGKVGGASGADVHVGDSIVAANTNAGGDQAAVGADWFILEHSAGALQASNNLSDLANAATARTNLSLNNVTNNAQTRADIVPNTAPAVGGILVGNAGGTAYAPVAMSGDVTIDEDGVTTVATLNQNTTGTATKATNLVGGNGTTLLGSVPYQSGTDATTQLAPNTTTTKKFLRQTGTGTNGAAPAWDTIVAGDLPAALTPTTIELGHASDTTLSRVSAGVVAIEGNNILTTASAAGKVAQVVYTTSNTRTTTAVNIPIDDTVVQNTEGAEYITLAITPTNASSNLIIEFSSFGDGSALAHLIVALFVDSTASALWAADLHLAAADRPAALSFLP